MNDTAILIPARWASTRFPGKPLAPLNGIPMVRMVYEHCRKAAKEINADVYVLTDHEDICLRFEPDEVWFDYNDYANGTERCAGFANSKKGQGYNKFVNVQGDMPDVTTEIIKKAHWHLQNYSVTTVFTNMPSEKQNDPNSVKMVRAGDQALWFGRGMTGYGEWHLGVYGYKRNSLDMYRTLRIETEEEIEKLEQLRWLKNGWQIGCLSVQYNGVEINTPEDIKEWHNKNSQ